MKEKILIVEDEFIEAHDLQIVLEKASYKVIGIARSVDTALKMIREDRPDFVMLDIFLKGIQTGIDLARHLHKTKIPFVYLSANSSPEVLAQAKATHPYGFLVKPFRERDILVTLEIARYHHEFITAAEISKGAVFRSQLDVLLSKSTFADLMLIEIGKALQSYIHFEYLSVVRFDIKKNTFTDKAIFRIGFEEYQYVGPQEMQQITRKNISQLFALSVQTEDKVKAVYYQEPEFVKLCRSPNAHGLIAEQFQMNSLLVCPLILADGNKIHLNFYSSKTDVYGAKHLEILSELSPSLIIAVQKMLKMDLTSTDTVDLIDTSESAAPTNFNHFDGMVGISHSILKIFDQINVVAPTNTSVLLLGESGTGKERVASCIHALSERRYKPFIKVNCANLPKELIESELFGHEKGAFTGAYSRRPGKFELANKGTILLDEIGEMNIDVQVRLLRVLQDQEIEPLGANSAFKIDVRIIAASNKNLEKEVSEGRFRLDLFYRLFVFPIHIPALRDRTEDIPALVTHFSDLYNKKLKKNIRPFSDKLLQQLMLYSWPGNIRELEHMIERTFLMTKGNEVDQLVFPIALDQKVNHNEQKIKTILENEREHIIAVLKKCNGKVWGEGGAAELLNVPPSTLNSKIRKLQINKFNFS
jgi:DNA-binding NtrC family response regulator